MLEQLLTALNTSGIMFVRDALTKAPNADYGVVDYASVNSLWADDAMIEQFPTVAIWLYVRDGDTKTALIVQDIINRLDFVLGWRLVSREYVQESNMIQWQWQARLEGM